ncbi:salicylate hydroxylase [Polychaeton citri CBS 116435]|uniref:Salicylate hydroxylase n=1 Tax=Polychaeton citri CBS 116435 TaxID=1314669 RepID=A0A9P4UN13_9PEZI|nr:salicylate hydroxylase [Polychaeton citri CBS 116435]
MPEKLRIIVCGAGIAGLCTGIALAKLGHEIIILERAHELSPAGAGIHGLLDRLASRAVVPTGFIFRRYEDSSVLAETITRRPEHTSQTPYWSIRRSDYQETLHVATLEAGCDIRLGQKVCSINENGDSLVGDIVVVADGMKSSLRQFIIPEEDVSPISQPMSTYRAWAPLGSLVANPDVARLLHQPATNVWIGPGRHIIIYPAEGGEILAINGTYPARNNSVGEWNKLANVEEVQRQFHEFDPVVQAILGQARGCKSWALAEVPRLPRWTSRSGKVVAIGDAAHGMLQFLAQGAAMATEDAGALAECVRKITSTDDIPRAMHVYERSRKWRCERVQAQARCNGEFIHMPDGEEQEHRDRKMGGKQLPTDEDVDCGPLLDPKFTSWLFNHNTLEHVVYDCAEKNRQVAVN